MWCTKCGKELEENAVTCDACGTEVRCENVTVPEVEEVPEETKEEAEEMNEKDAGQETGNSEEIPEEEKQDGTPAESQKKKIDLSVIKRHWLKLALGITVIFLLVYAVKYYQVKDELAKTNSKYSEVTAKYNSICTENITLEDKINTLELENEELKNGAATMLVSIRNLYETQKWDEVISAAAELHEKYNGSEEDKEAQKLAKESQGQIDAAKAAEEAKKAKGYETGITYEQMIRTPDEYKREKVKFSGKVIQVLDENSTIGIRIAIDGNNDMVIYGYYNSFIVSRRILEGDNITIYGTFQGIETYETVLGKPVSLPQISIDKIDQ